jgi:hypothetical protein
MQSANICSKEVTLLKSKKDISKLVKDWQLENAFSLVVNLLVLIFKRFIRFKLIQSLKIFCIESTFEKSKIDISILSNE